MRDIRSYQGVLRKYRPPQNNGISKLDNGSNSNIDDRGYIKDLFHEGIEEAEGPQIIHFASQQMQ